jgi:hypothetical protein
MYCLGLHIKPAGCGASGANLLTGPTEEEEEEEEDEWHGQGQCHLYLYGNDM